MPPSNRKNNRRGSTAKSRQGRTAGRPRTSPGGDAAADRTVGNAAADRTVGNGAAGLTGLAPSRDVLPDLDRLDKLPPGLKAATAPVKTAPVKTAPVKTAPAKTAS